jgi:hypothetical protein
MYEMHSALSLKARGVTKVDLDHERLPLHSDERVPYSKFISCTLIAFVFLFEGFGEAMGLRGQD